MCVVHVTKAWNTHTRRDISIRYKVRVHIYKLDSDTNKCLLPLPFNEMFCEDTTDDVRCLLTTWVILEIFLSSF